MVPNIDVWLGVLYEPVPYGPGRTHRAQMISSPKRATCISGSFGTDPGDFPQQPEPE